MAKTKTKRKPFTYVCYICRERYASKAALAAHFKEKKAHDHMKNPNARRAKDREHYHRKRGNPTDFPWAEGQAKPTRTKTSHSVKTSSKHEERAETGNASRVRSAAGRDQSNASRVEGRGQDDSRIRFCPCCGTDIGTVETAMRLAKQVAN